MRIDVIQVALTQGQVKMILAFKHNQPIFLKIIMKELLYQY